MNNKIKGTYGLINSLPCSCENTKIGSEGIVAESVSERKGEASTNTTGGKDSQRVRATRESSKGKGTKLWSLLGTNRWQDGMCSFQQLDS